MRIIGTKLGLVIGLLLTLSVVIGLVSYTHTQLVRQKVVGLTDSSEPVNATVYALESNLVETGFAALGFLSTGDAALQDALAAARQRSQTLQETMGELPADFSRFERIAEEQVRLREIQTRTVLELSAALDSTAGVLSERIMTPATGKNPALARRLQAVREMEASVNALRSMVGPFLVTADPEFGKRVEAADQDFERFFRVYHDELLNPRKQTWSLRLRHLTRETVRLSRTLVGLETHRREELAEFLAIEGSLLASLNERIQTRTDSAQARIRQEILTAGERANATIIAVILFGVVFGVVAAALITRQVAHPIDELTLAMQGIARGEQARKVALQSGGALLGEAFNLMTERLLQTIERLQESETRFRTMFEDAPIGIAVSDDEGRLTQTNPALREMLGQTEGESGTYTFFGMVGPRDESPVEPPGPDQPPGRRPRYHREISLPRKDGSVAWINVNFSPMDPGPGGAPCSIMMMEDITARRATESKMRMLAQTITSLNESVVITDSHNIILSVNPAFTALYGYDEEEVLGKGIEILGLHGLPGSPVAPLREHVQAGGWAGELAATRKGGKVFPVLLSTSVVYDNTGSRMAIVSVSRDVTEQKRLQQQIQEAEQLRIGELRRFAVSVQNAQEEERARISRELHDDLCQRLTGMKFAAEVIADRIRPANKKVIHSLREFAAELDRSISDVRRISSNLRPSVLDDFGLVTALHMLCREFEALHGLRTTCEADSVMPGHIDPHVEIALYRIAQEALSNTAKHAQASAVAVRLQYQHSAFRLEVQDDGKGIAGEQPSHSRVPGHGLGLISMRERTELLGGRFQVRSAPTEGTTISVTIPLGEATPDEEDKDTDRG
jgi:PAS domain S-box-containing protein